MIQFKQHNQNKISSLGVGQIHLIKSWLDEMCVKNYVINDDLTINVDNYVNLHNKNLKQFPDYIQFHEIEFSFDCSCNQLISLRGCPKIVNDDFYCDRNQLESLEGCPEITTRNFWCKDNKKEFTKDEVKKYCKVKGTTYV